MFRVLNVNIYFMATLERAIEIAIKAHKGQLDRSGKPYIGHVLRVMSLGNSEEEKIVGMLHDLFEDTEITAEDLINEGFSSEIIAAIDLLTKEETDNDYISYIKKIKSNYLAKQVKLNDLTDNMNIKRLERLTNDDLERLNKYLSAYHELTN